ncbi:BTB/POZ domain-containing protein 6-like isoform X2 [Eriocheir sinensis]|uniref:BTB/POZ domain-containing protein 6-like isoform X2 n=1 Tax=Eriocheir sinensis TaxID=95602 RepID=UPI0021CA882F|nr:BTB/POZ domain-containing protein 6-like isoform X2 [Eriocheir sinensis]
MDAPPAYAPTQAPPTTGPMDERLREAHNLYENEERSDVVFQVGDGSFKERIPAHSFVLSARNHVFRAMFHETWADRHKKVYTIPNDPRGFQNLLKWLYRQECGFQSLDSSLTTLHVAIQYLCPELADLCGEYITHQLRASNVLRVMQDIHRYCPAPLTTVPSAPPLEVLEGRSQEVFSTMTSDLRDLRDESDIRDPTACCSDLFNECLEILDQDASSVLASEGVEELDRQVLEVILKRQTLRVQSEVEVVEAVVRWSTAQCKRECLPLTQQSRRKMLGDLLYYLRLLKLTPEQLNVAAKLLDKDEFEYIRVVVSARTGRSIPPPPTSLAPYLKHMATARGALPSSVATPEPPPAAGRKKKNSNKKRYTKKELILDIVSCLSIIFD